MKFLFYIPLSLHYITQKVIGNDVKTILELGCGKGEFMKLLSNGKHWEIIGIEIFKPYIVEAARIGVYNRLINSDITKLPSYIKREKFDVVLCLQLIEHLDKSIAIKKIQEWEKMAVKKIIITTPVGFMKYDRVECDNKQINEVDIHRSGWYPHEFRKRGYTVRGQGLGLIYGDKGLVRILPKFTWPFLVVFSFLFSWLVYFVPELAAYMIVVKNKTRYEKS